MASKRYQLADILLSARRHYARHGQWPTAHDWRHATKDHPSNQTVLDKCGTWNEMIRLAGGIPRGPGRPKIRSRDSD